MRGNVTIKDDKFTMPDNNVEVKAIFRGGYASRAPTEHTVTVTSGGNGTAASPAKAVAGVRSP